MQHLDLILYEEAARCLLCENAPCSNACGKGDPARALRAIRFNNEKNAWRWLNNCSDEDLQRAEEACIHYDHPIRIREVAEAVRRRKTEDTRQETEGRNQQTEGPSLAITFCGIPCENPFFLASSSICTNYAMGLAQRIKK
jgi:dihydropyrimidine dehydrogenase (NAD+) subunit PreA